HGVALLAGIPYDAKPRLKLLPGRRNISVRRKARFADEWSEENLAGGCDRIRLDLGVPAQTVTQREVRTDEPLVLDKHGGFHLRDGLGTGFLNTLAPDPRKLEKQQQRARDRSASRAGSRIIGAPIRALDESRADVHVVHEPLHAIEDIAAVGEPEKGLTGRGAIQFHADLEIMSSVDQRQVVIHLEPRVEILYRDEKRQTEAILSAEIDSRIREWPALSRQAWSSVVARPVLP